jgi:hypothetical protein
MNRRRLALIGAGVVVSAIVIVVVGRFERRSEQRRNLNGIALVRSLVGAQIGKPDNYRVSPGLYCLLYGEGGRSFALELCDDQYGRLVEAVDRRGTLPVFYSLTSEPGIANERVDLSLVTGSISRLQKAALRAALLRGTAAHHARRSTHR